MSAKEVTTVVRGRVIKQRRTKAHNQQQSKLMHEGKRQKRATGVFQPKIVVRRDPQDPPQQTKHSIILPVHDEAVDDDKQETIETEPVVEDTIPTTNDQLPQEGPVEEIDPDDEIETVFPNEEEERARRIWKRDEEERKARALRGETDGTEPPAPMPDILSEEQVASIAAAEALKVDPPPQIPQGDEGRNPYFGQADYAHAHFNIRELVTEITDEQLTWTDPMTVEFRRRSGLNWVAVFHLIVIQEVTELAADDLEHRGAEAAQGLVDTFHKCLVSREGIKSFLPIVIRERPELRPFRSQLIRTFGLLNVLGSHIACVPPEGKKNMPRDDPSVLFEKIGAV
jgi:hypothetical protein